MKCNMTSNCFVIASWVTLTLASNFCSDVGSEHTSSMLSVTETRSMTAATTKRCSLANRTIFTPRFRWQQTSISGEKVHQTKPRWPCAPTGNSGQHATWNEETRTKVSKALNLIDHYLLPAPQLDPCSTQPTSHRHIRVGWKSLIFPTNGRWVVGRPCFSDRFRLHDVSRFWEPFFALHYATIPHSAPLGFGSAPFAVVQGSFSPGAQGQHAAVRSVAGWLDEKHRKAAPVFGASISGKGASGFGTGQWWAEHNVHGKVWWKIIEHFSSGPARSKVKHSTK